MNKKKATNNENESERKANELSLKEKKENTPDSKYSMSCVMNVSVCNCATTFSLFLVCLVSEKCACFVTIMITAAAHMPARLNEKHTHTLPLSTAEILPLSVCIECSLP